MRRVREGSFCACVRAFAFIRMRVGLFKLISLDAPLRLEAVVANRGDVRCAARGVVTLRPLFFLPAYHWREGSFRLWIHAVRWVDLYIRWSLKQESLEQRSEYPSFQLRRYG